MNNTVYNKPKLKYRVALLIISLMIIFVDQVTKVIVKNYLHLFQTVNVNKYCAWTLTYNQGAAFSLFADQGGWQRVFFGVIATAVAILLVYFILNKTYNMWIGIAISFILGGAVGNLVDRIIAGKVTDFIDWHLGGYHWPTFNLADSFICIGVVMFLIDSIFFKPKK